VIPKPPTYLIKLTKFCGWGINNVELSELVFLALSDDSEKLFVNCSVLYNKDLIVKVVSLPQFFFPIESF
jgi:hypothetical protein